MVTLAEAARPIRRDAASARASVLRMGLAGRLGMAAAAILLLWTAIALGSS